MKNKFLFLLIGLFLLSSVSALDCWATFKQNTEIELIQKCPSCSYVNITSITYPNGTVFLNEEMQKNGTNFNFTLPDSSQEGTISYGTIGDKNGANPPNSEDLCIRLTRSGGFMQTAESLMYITILIILAIIIAVGVYLFMITPYENIMDKNAKTPTVIKVTKNKYVKLTVLLLTIGITFLFSNTLTSITNNYIQFGGVKVVFNGLNMLIKYLALGSTVAIAWLMFYNFWKDIVLNKKILGAGKAVLRDI